MNPLIQPKKPTPLTLAVFVLVCLTLSPRVQAVVPAPDGGYPGGNTAEGQAALFSLTTGSFNTAVGFLSLRSNTTSQFNTAIGAGTLLANTADENTATGTGALFSNTTGGGNTANGVFALFSNTTGLSNTATGEAALQNNTTGNNNTANGWGALGPNTAGSGNTALGFEAGTNVTTADHVICIGSAGANVSNTCFIGEIRGVTTINNDAVPVMIDSAGQLGTASSSRRFKTDIKPIDKTSECVLGLKPVSFRYKIHKDMTPQFGLIAEEVAQVNPNLVIYDADGKPYTVRYDAVNAMLLNEFLKEHKKVEKQEATITQLKNDFQTVNTQQRKEIQLLSAQLKEQAAQIQKVSAQLELSKPGPQTVRNND